MLAPLLYTSRPAWEAPASFNPSPDTHRHLQAGDDGEHAPGWIVFGWYTPDYAHWFAGLEKSLIAHGAPYDFWSVPKLAGGWERNTRRKAEFALAALALHPAQAEQKPSPRVKAVPTGWILQGRVFNAQSQPVAGFSVFFVSASGQYIPQYGFAYTDSSGHFQLSYAGGNGSAPAPSPFFLEVANTASTPVYRASSPFQPNYGGSTYQSITLPKTAPRMPKPGNIR